MEFRFPSAASRTSLLPTISVVNALESYHLPSWFISVIYRPLRLFRPLVLGTFFLSNSSGPVTLHICSVYVVYNSNISTHFFNFQYPVVIFISKAYSLGHIVDVIISWHVPPLKSYASIYHSLTMTFCHSLLSQCPEYIYSLASSPLSLYFAVSTNPQLTSSSIPLSS